MSDRTRTIEGVEFTYTGGEHKRWSAPDLGLSVHNHWGPRRRVGEPEAETFVAFVTYKSGEKEWKGKFRTIEGAVRWGLDRVRPRERRPARPRQTCIVVIEVGELGRRSFGPFRSFRAADRAARAIPNEKGNAYVLPIESPEAMP